ncbi:MAG: hypothetical protein WBJ41_10620 [Chromatiaceae bacterium]
MVQRDAPRVLDHLAAHADRIATKLTLVAEHSEYVQEGVGTLSGTPEKRKAS